MYYFGTHGKAIGPLIVALTCLIWGFVSPVNAAEYYIAKNGNDTTGDGSSGKPWQNIEACLRKSQIREGDTFIIGPGTYYVGANTSGKAIRIVLPNITIRGSAGSANTILDGTSVTEGDKDLLTNWTYDCHGLTLDGLTLANARRKGISLNARLLPRSYGENITISNCIIRGSRDMGIYCGFTDNLWIHDCETYDNAYNEAIVGDAEIHEIYINNSDDMVIEDVYCHDSQGQGTIHINGDCYDGAQAWCNRPRLSRIRVKNCRGNAADLMNCNDGILENFLVWDTPATTYGSQSLVDVTWDDSDFSGYISNPQPSQRCIIRNNTIIASNRNRGIELYPMNSSRAKNCVVFNNVVICTDASLAIHYGSSDNHTVIGNYVSTNSSSVLSANFSDPSSGDYHLKATSAFINAGVASATNSVTGTKYAPANDLDGLLRPYGSGYDQGAYEYGSSGGGGETYVLQVGVEGNGQVTRTPNQSTYTSGQQVRLDATPGAGWMFAGWSGGLTGSTNPDTLVITNNTTVTATFAAQVSQRPAVPTVVSLAEPAAGCLRVIWQANSESNIAGYKIYRGLASVEKGQAAAYTDSVDAGNVTSKDICSLSSARYYIAVKAYNSNGQYSDYSAERNLFIAGSQPIDAFGVSRWTLDETSGTLADDSFGSSDGTLVNGASFRSTGGPVNGAVEFDGASDYIDVGTMDIPDGPGMAIAFWFRADDFEHASARFISKATGTAEADHYWMVGTVNSTGLRFRLRAGGTTTTVETSTGQIQAGRWYHIAATYDGAKMRIYKDGVSLKEADKTGIVDTNSSVDAALGNQPAGAGTDLGFDGLLDDVRVYNRALTTTEISSLMALSTNSPPLARFTATPTSGYVTLQVQFDASTSSDPEGGPLTYSWNFGDGTTGTGSNPQHPYTTAGTHEVLLTVRDDGGKTDVEYGSIQVNESTGPPMIPAWETLLETAPGCIELAWQANTEPDLAGYVVYYGSMSVTDGEAASYSDSIDVHNVTTKTQCGFAHGTFYFALRAYNSAREFSGYSVEEHVHVEGPDLSGPAIIVASPENGAVNVDPVGTNIFVVISDGRTGVDSTSVEVSINGQAPAHITFNGNPSSYTAACEPDGDLPSSTVINVSVSVSDRASPPNVTTTTWSFTTGTIPPSAPGGLRAENAGTGCVDVTWQANQETDIAGYTIYFGTSSVTSGEASQYDDSTAVGSTTSHTVCGLIDGTYYFAMRAKNSSGQYSTLSGEVMADVTIAGPDKPKPPQRVQVSETSPGCLTITWRANTESDIAGYVVYDGSMSVVGGDASVYEDSVDVANHASKELCGFVAGLRYVAIRAYNTEGIFSDYSTEKRVEVLGDDLEPPTILVGSPVDGAVDVPQDTEIFFALSDARSGIDSTSLELRINGAAPSQITFSGDPARYAVVCRPAGELPELRAITVDVSISDLAPAPNTKSASWSFTTGQNRPSNPEGFTVSGTETGCAHLSWSANSETDLAGYRIYFGLESVEGGAASSYDDSISVGRLTSETVCGLLSGTYYFALRARDEANHLSGLSEEMSAVVGNSPTEAPTAPQNVQLSETDPGCVLVQWGANAESDIAGYIVYHRAFGGPSEYRDSVDVGKSTRKSVCGFEQGAYGFVVRAYDTARHYSVPSTEKWLDVVGPDHEAPKVIVGGPFHGAVEVRPSTLVFFVVSDEQSGVDASSLRVSIRGSAPSGITFRGDASGYAVVCDPSGSLPINSTVKVTVTVRDLATPPNETTVSWSFSTGSTADISPPVFFSYNPGDGAKEVDPRATITVGVRDKSGIDLSTMLFFVDGVHVAETTTREEANGDVVIEYSNPGGFARGSTVNIEVNVDDLAANRATLDFSFETAAAAVDTGPAVAIMPDGYWVGDPTRALEIRNLPPGWRVKIFSTAHSKVREFRNDGDNAVDWAWDFANDSGRRVVKSMYLVRVLDHRGSVKKTGKFVVQ